MGSSFTNFRGHGFWSRDDYIEDLAREVAAAVNADESKEEWLSQLASHWQLQSSGAFSGWVHLRLDEFLVSEERRKRLCAVVESVMDAHPSEHPTHRTGALMRRLLHGEMTTDASSPLGYMVGRRPSRASQTTMGLRPIVSDC